MQSEVSTFTEANNAVRLQDTTFASTDGYALAATVYTPSTFNDHAILHAILLNSGTGVKRGFYQKFAFFLASHGFAVVTYDYRGIGDSLRVPIHSFDTSMREWGEKDCVAAIDFARRAFPEARLSVIGHSAGGKILGFAPNNVRIHSLVTIAVPNSWWGLWKHPLKRLEFFMLVQFVMPGLAHLLSYFPAKFLGLGENYPKHVALDWARWSRRREYILHLERGHHPNYFGTMTGAVLAVSFDDDRVASGAAAESLMRFYQNARSQKHWHIVPKAHGIQRIGHSGFFRETCAPLWMEIVTWLRAT
jgi:predicted alpha/beta hydrolase